MIVFSFESVLTLGLHGVIAGFFLPFALILVLKDFFL